MTISFDDILHGPVFDVFGNTATLAPRTGGSHAITVRDRTKGVEMTDQNVGLMTVQPVAEVRASVLAGLGLSESDLTQGTLTIAGVAWSILSTMPRPSPSGPDDGTVWLILMRAG